MRRSCRVGKARDKQDRTSKMTETELQERLQGVELNDYSVFVGVAICPSSQVRHSMVLYLSDVRSKTLSDSPENRRN